MFSGHFCLGKTRKEDSMTKGREKGKEEKGKRRKWGGGGNYLKLVSLFMNIYHGMKENNRNTFIY